MSNEGRHLSLISSLIHETSPIVEVTYITGHVELVFRSQAERHLFIGTGQI